MPFPSGLKDNHESRMKQKDCKIQSVVNIIKETVLSRYNIAVVFMSSQEL